MWECWGETARSTREIDATGVRRARSACSALPVFSVWLSGGISQTGQGDRFVWTKEWRQGLCASYRESCNPQTGSALSLMGGARQKFFACSFRPKSPSAKSPPGTRHRLPRKRASAAFTGLSAWRRHHALAKVAIDVLGSATTRYLSLSPTEGVRVSGFLLVRDMACGERKWKANHFFVDTPSAGPRDGGWIGLQRGNYAGFCWGVKHIRYREPTVRITTLTGNAPPLRTCGPCGETRSPETVFLFAHQAVKQAIPRNMRPPRSSTVSMR